jgi:hypothetical protein
VHALDRQLGGLDDARLPQKGNQRVKPARTSVSAGARKKLESAYYPISMIVE